MVHPVVDNLNLVQNEVFLKSRTCKVIVISKTFQIDQISPLIDIGHLHFGENKVQEAKDKWGVIKKYNKNIQLHMVGKLQSNKVKFAVHLFDYIHSLDNEKLAKKISVEQEKINKNLKIFIQVNIGDEKQKSGVHLDNLKDFYDTCCKKYFLNIIGLMCIPPKEIDVKSYFKKMSELNKSFGLKELSMGMSSDYLEAINFGATYVRIGSKIFGSRS
jgi:pyridoxal phosphate enzyme (YggS family)